MPEWKAKLDANGRRIIDDPTGRADLEALVRVRRPMNAIARQALLDAGATIHTESGVILTIELRADALRTVAELDFIVRIEISRPMSVEGKI